MRAALLVLLYAGCCEDMYFIASDTSAQPAASISFGPSDSQPTVETGQLTTTPSAGAAFDTTLLASDRFVLHVPAGASGAVAASLDVMFADGSVQTISVMATVSVKIDEVCLQPDQPAYGSEPCGDSYLGTIDLEATGTSLGDVAADWMLDQLAVPTKGTPDC